MATKTAKSTTKGSKMFQVIQRDRESGDDGRDDRLVLVPVADGPKQYDPMLLRIMGIQLQEGDEVEISARVLTRMKTERVQIENP